MVDIARVVLFVGTVKFCNDIFYFRDSLPNGSVYQIFQVLKPQFPTPIHN